MADENTVGSTEQQNENATPSPKEPNDQQNENTPSSPKEPAVLTKRGKPPLYPFPLIPEDFAKFTTDDFISTLFENTQKSHGGLSLKLASATTMYTSPGLAYLETIHTKRLSMRGAPHVPSIFLFCFNSFAATRHKPLRTTVARQLVQLYEETFNENDEDQTTFRKLYDYGNKNSSQLHIALLVCKSTTDGTIMATNCELLAGLSCSCHKEIGTVLKWIATNTQIRLTTDLVSKKKADGLPLHGRGIGTLLLVILQAILEMCDYETQIFAEVNVEKESPGKWYREKLFFAPCIMQQEKLPEFVQQHSLKDPALVLYNSTIKIRDIFIRESFQNTVSVSTMLVNARAILTSFAMPRLRASGGAIRKVPSDIYHSMEDCVRAFESTTGVLYKDSIDGSPSGSMPQIDGNDRELQGVWAKYVAASPALKLPYVKTVELGMGNCKGAKEEKSCLYCCLSNAVFGTPKYYWQLRMVAAYALYAFSYMPATHPLLDPTTFYFSPVTDEIMEAADPEETDDESGGVTDEFEKKMLALRRMSRKIISGSTDAGQTELNILTYMLKGIVVSTLRVYTQDRKPGRREEDQRRHWKCTLTEMSTPKSMLEPINCIVPVVENEYDRVIIAHVQGIHYVAVDITFARNELSDATGKFGEFSIEYEDFLSDDEEHEFLEVDAALRRFLANELKERKELYNYSPDERNFNAALKHVAEKSTNDANQNLVPLKRKKDKMDALILKLGQDGADGPNRRQKDYSKYLRLKVGELERRRDADKSNEDIEASLHLATRTKSLMFDGKQFFAVVAVPSLKREVIVAVERDWVEQCFHKSFLQFMRTFGRVAGYTALENPKEFEREEVQGECRVVSLEIRYYFNVDYPTWKYFLHYRAEKGNPKNTTVRAEVSREWIEEQVNDKESLMDYDMRFLHTIECIANGSNNSDNCPCFDAHPKDSNHSKKCFRQANVVTEDNDDFVFHLDKRQMHSIRWDRHKNMWQGLCKSMKPAVQDDVIDLTDEWVTQNFSAELIELFKARGQQRRLFVKLPPGAPRSNCFVPDTLQLTNAPKIAFRQEDGFCCVSNGLASALHYLNEHTMALQLHELGMSLTNGGKHRSDRIVGETREFMRKYGRAWTPHKVSHSIDLCDPQGFPPRTTPRLVVLEAEDGDSGHAVTMVGQWIFDSNFATALPLCRAALDFICGEGGAMTGFRIGYDFRPPTGVRSTTPKWQTRKRKRKPLPVAILEDDAGVL